MKEQIINNISTEHNTEQEQFTEIISLAKDLIGEEQLELALTQEGPVTIHNTSETSDISISEINSKYPNLKYNLIRSSHTGVLQVMQPKDHRSIFTIHAQDNHLPWTNYIYEMTRIPNNGDNETNGADYYYRPDLEAYETEDGIKLKKLDLKLSSGEPLDNNNGSYLKATSFVFVDNGNNQLERLSHYWRNRITEIKPDAIFAYEAMNEKSQETEQFLDNFLNGVEVILETEGNEQANESLELLTNRYGVESEGCYYSNSKLKIESADKYHLVKSNTKDGTEEPEEKILHSYSKNELIQSIIKGIKLPGLPSPLDNDEKEYPIPLLSLDSTIALWSKIFSEDVKINNSIHHFHIHAGGGDMAGLPPIYEGYMFSKNGRHKGRKENLNDIFETYNLGLQKSSGNTDVKEQAHIIMIPARIYDAVLQDEELPKFNQLTFGIRNERLKAQQSLQLINLTLNEDYRPNENDIKEMVPVARKAIKKFSKKGDRKYLQRIKDVLENPTYPYNLQKMQKLIINWVCDGDGHETNRIWRQAVDDIKPNWKPAQDALKEVLPNHYLKRVSNNIPENFNDGGVFSHDEVITDDLNFAFDDLSIPLATLVNSSIRDILEQE